MNIDDPQFKASLLNELRTGFTPLKKSRTPPHVNAAGTLSLANPECSDEIQSLLHDINEDDLINLPPKGLAHDHVRLSQSKYLLRIPKQSQMQFGAQDNLDYQTACFQHMHPSAHTPECFGTVPVAAQLPMGCLVVEYIEGRPLTLPKEINCAANALAAIHRLALPNNADRQPLLNQNAPLEETLKEVLVQSEYLDQSQASCAVKQAIKHQLNLAIKEIDSLSKSPVSLISFDAHPGNFLITPAGKAYLVDLEKARYGGAGFDLAHATLYTSTTWDENCYCTLTRSAIQSFYSTWQNAIPDQLYSALQPHLLPMRRLMWLWSLTWCAKWGVESKRKNKTDKQTLENAENWSAENSSSALIKHVEERVNHYLDIDTINTISQEFEH